MKRRLAAILAADVEGYSAHVGRDELGTIQALRGHVSAMEPVIGLNGGRIVKSTGDGFLAEFASVVDAVACAETMQRQIADRNAAAGDGPRLDFRMGIHVGDILAEGDDILGDGVNIAARLEGIAPAGGVVISGRVHEEVAGKLDLAFDAMGPQKLKNIANPVPAFALRLDTAVPAAPASAAQPRPSKPSVAVLAFDNLSSDPEQDYFADGITEDIITGLSRLPFIFVIARNSSFAYKGLSVDIRKVGRDLGVAYVLEGSVRRAGARLRVNGQLIDTETGAHLWADRYDGQVEDVFDLQDRITTAVIGAIAPQIRTAEIERAALKRPDTMDAYDHFLRAQAEIARFHFGAADEQLERAVALSPGYTQPKALRAWLRTLLWNPDIRPTQERYDFAIRVAHDVLDAPDADLEAQAYAGYTLAFLGDDLDLGLSLVDRAVSTCPNLVSAWGSSCVLHALMGEAETALAHAEEAFRLNPADPLSYRIYMGMSLAHIARKDYPRLLEVAHRARAFHNSVPIFRLNEIVARAALGEMDRARDLARLYVTREPDFTVSLFRSMRESLKLMKIGVYDDYYRLLGEVGIPQ